MHAIRSRLILSSALVLFLELALIRWLGSNVVHLSYFTNFVLLGSFLGIGLGFLLSRTERSVARFSPLVLAALVGFVLAVPVHINASSAQLVYFTSLKPSGPPLWLALPLIFATVAATLMGPAEIVGRCFKQLAPLDAYRLDLIGSLLGIAAFTGLSFLRAPSVAWGIVVSVAYLVLLRPFRFAAVACPVLVGLLAVESLGANVSWSPYYKIELTKGTVDGAPYVGITVNGVPHQAVLRAAVRLRDEPLYGLPYKRLAGNSLGRVLIVGSGGGSDVAIALKKRARHVDAVEIDPRILEIGEQKNPDRPYQDPRVTTHVDDGRAFLERTHSKYDLILFALPDSLALVTGASTIRLESYLFTREALASVRDHLAPGGGFAMYNFFREKWLAERLAGTVAQAFGHEPCVDLGGAGSAKTPGGRAVISVALDEHDQSCAPGTQTTASARVAPATDDKPFVYFRGGFLPRIHLFALGLILLVSLISVRLLGGPFRSMRPYADLFFMGAAFLLLETKSVTTFALLFGTTWIVNAIVFAGVLLAVLLAVETARRFRTPPLSVLYLGIIGALALAFAVPNDIPLSLAFMPRLVTAVSLAFAPIYLANLAFSKRFAVTGDSRTAFAVNILGAMVGGCVEYAALLIGYRDLLIVVAILYLAAFLFTPRRALAVG